MAFGELKNSKLIAMNAPKFTSVIEPFGDSGTVALYPGFKKVSNHIVNILDEEKFNLFTFLQGQTGADKSNLKARDWISSQEAFDAALGLNAIEGADLFYQFFYLKKFGVRSLDPDTAPTYDLLSVGEDMKSILYTLPLYRIGLKKVTITNDDPMSLVTGGGSGTFIILAPKSPEDAQSVESKLPSIAAEFIYLKKSMSSDALIESVNAAGEIIISTFAASSIMMQDMEVRTNYEHKEREKLKVIDPELLQEAV